MSLTLLGRIIVARRLFSNTILMMTNKANETNIDSQGDLKI
jgi:hypothetical protein